MICNNLFIMFSRTEKYNVVCRDVRMRFFFILREAETKKTDDDNSEIRPVKLY